MEDDTDSVRLNNMLLESPNELRQELLFKALNSSKDNSKPLDAIFFETTALCIGFRSSHFLDNNKKSKPITMDEMLDELTTFDETPDECRKQFIEYPALLEMYEQNMDKNKIKFKAEIKNNHKVWNFTDPIKGIGDMIQSIKSLPEEWTVIQLCKEYDPENSKKSIEESRCTNLPIYITLFKYDRWELNDHKPIRICMKMDGDENIFYEICKYQLMVNNNAPTANYSEFVLECRNTVKKLAENLKEILGCWRHLFIGHKTDRSHLQKIYESVDSFCEEWSFNIEQKVLLSLFATKIDRMQNKVELKQVADYIGDTEFMTITVYNFLDELSTSKIVKTLPKDTLHPIIILVDETIDNFHWELLNPEQETVRNINIDMLMFLYDLHIEKIKDGYLHLEVQKPFMVLNSNNDLPNMEKRMESFLKFWLPKSIIHKQSFPNVEEFTEKFNQCDCYIYCGHGSGIQTDLNSLVHLDFNKPAFLMGCESVAFRYNGINQERKNDYLWFLSHGCPATIGYTYLVTDMSTDRATSSLLSLWTPTKSRKDFQDISLPEWNNGVLVFQTPKTNKKLYAQRSQKLTKIISELRLLERTIDTRLKASLVYRGLPIYNTLVK